MPKAPKGVLVGQQAPAHLSQESFIHLFQVSDTQTSLTFRASDSVPVDEVLFLTAEESPNLFLNSIANTLGQKESLHCVIGGRVEDTSS